MVLIVAQYFFPQRGALVFEALSTEKPSPPHVLYLTQAYKPNFEAWEAALRGLFSGFDGPADGNCRDQPLSFDAYFTHGWFGWRIV